MFYRMYDGNNNVRMLITIQSRKKVNKIMSYHFSVSVDWHGANLTNMDHGVVGFVADKINLKVVKCKLIILLGLLSI